MTAGLAAALVLAGAALALLNMRAPSEIAAKTQSANDDAIAAGGRVGGGFAGLTGLGDRVRDAWSASDKIKALQKENAELREWKEMALALAERQQRYERLLAMPREDLGRGNNVSNAVTARLILDPGGPFKRTLLANAGADHGVKVGYVALNENGLIGRVVSVGRRSARILLVDDYNSRVPVMGETSRARALMIGQAGQRPVLDAGESRLASTQLQYVVGAGGFRRGERLVTSGDGGIYPRGLLVGWAEEVGGGSWAAKLGAARQPIDYIRLIPFYRPDLPPDAVADEQSLPRPPQSLFTGPAMAVPAAPAPPAPPKPKPRSIPVGPPTGADEDAAPGPPQ